MELVTPHIASGGCDTVFVMPNLQKPIVSVKQALEYHKNLSRIAPDVRFLMSLYLHPDVTVEQIDLASEEEDIFGVKLYPAGVTTNSQQGVRDIKSYYPVFAAMESGGLVLNLHGEDPNSDPMKAESDFLPQLFALHEKFPNLRIVSETAF